MNPRVAKGGVVAKISRLLQSSDLKVWSVTAVINDQRLARSQKIG